MASAELGMSVLEAELCAASGKRLLFVRDCNVFFPALVNAVEITMLVA